MNSRDRFSLGAAAVLSLPSNQISMAGSTIMAWARSGKRAGGARRAGSRSGRPSAAACRTFCTLVAKWPCQNQVSRSVELVLGAHHPVQPPQRRPPAGRPAARRCAAGGPPGSASLADPLRPAGAPGSGCAAAPGSTVRAGGRSRVSSQAAQPARCRCASSPGRQPNPNRSVARRTSAASSSTGSGMPPWSGPPAGADNGSGRAFSGSTGTPMRRIGRAIRSGNGAALATVDRPDRPASTEGTTSDRSAPATRRRVRRDRQRRATPSVSSTASPRTASSTTGAAGSATGRPSGPGATRSSSAPTGT